MKIKLHGFGFEKEKESLFKLQLGNENRYDFHTKTITIDREYADPFTLDHELGHAIMDEITFEKTFVYHKIPNYMIAVKYAWVTSLAPEGTERADEGWAQSFCDYFNRHEYLKKESPLLFSFWNDVMNRNPEILRIRTSLHNQLIEKTIIRKFET